MQIHLLKFTHSSTRFLSHSGFDEGGGWVVGATKGKLHAFVYPSQNGI